MIRKALVVGISRYPNFRGRGQRHDLENAPKDAEAIAHLLRNCGRFEVEILPKTESDGAYQTDEKGIVKAEQLETAIYNLFVPPKNGMTPQTALLFFAGHGLAIEKFDETIGYLCASDTNKEQQNWGVPLNWLAKQLAKSQISEQIIWLDCCHSGKLTQEILEQANPGKQNHVNRSIIASCRDSETSLDVDGHGVLTHLLKKALNPEQYAVGFHINSGEIKAAVEREFHAHPKFKTYPQRLIFFDCESSIHFWEGRGKQSEISQRLGLKGQKIPSKEEITQPFISGTPITQPRYFFGRQYYLKRLFDLLKRHPLQNAAIIGKPRSGKTSLLRYLEKITIAPTLQLRPDQKSDWLPLPENYRWIFVDFHDSRMHKREGLMRYILEQLKQSVPTPCDLDRFMEVVTNTLRSPTVILLDEISIALKHCPELDDSLWNCFRSWASNSRNNLAFVLASREAPTELARKTGHSSPFFNIFGYSARLGELTEEEARELIASSPIPFAENDIKWILDESGCWPILLQILCRERLFTLEYGETGDNWRQEGLRQIHPFVGLLETD